MHVARHLMSTPDTSLYLGRGEEGAKLVRVLPYDLRKVQKAQRAFVEFAHRFQTIEHPHILGVQKVLFSSSGEVRLSSDWFSGKSLERWLFKEHNNVLKVFHAVEVTSQILKALRQLHGLGLVHGRLGPHAFQCSASMSGEVEWLRMVDLGCGAEVHRSGSGECGLEVSRDWAGPEPWRLCRDPRMSAAQGATIQGDLYAVGVCLYRFLTGGLPFFAESSRAALQASKTHKRLDRVPAQSRMPYLSDYPELLEVLKRALSASLEDRYHSAEEFLQDLDALSLVHDLSFVELPPDVEPAPPVSLVRLTSLEEGRLARSGELHSAPESQMVGQERLERFAHLLLQVTDELELHLDREEPVGDNSILMSLFDEMPSGEESAQEMPRPVDVDEVSWVVVAVSSSRLRRGKGSGESERSDLLKALEPLRDLTARVLEMRNSAQKGTLVWAMDAKHRPEAVVGRLLVFLMQFERTAMVKSPAFFLSMVRGPAEGKAMKASREVQRVVDLAEGAVQSTYGGELMATSEALEASNGVEFFSELQGARKERVKASAMVWRFATSS